MATIDLNADLGEGDSGDDALLRIVSSCNIACGGHAGDRQSMTVTVQAALASGAAIGAHPGYPDREGFGRESGFMHGEALYDSLTTQVRTLANICSDLGARLAHVKPHGALYNDAVNDSELADIVARVTAEQPGDVALVGMAGSELEHAATRHALRFIAEGFVDRAYEADGTLVSRKQPGAVHSELPVITSQATSLATRGTVTARNGDLIDVRVDTLCIHGDTPGAARAARAVRDVLETHGVRICA